MVRTILVGLDGTPDTEQAVEQGIRWAKLTGAELIGAAVVDEPTIRRPEPVGAWGSYYKQRRDEKRLKDAKNKVRAFLKQFADRCTAAGVRHQEREEIGVPAERLLRLSEDADLTLLGRESHFRFETQREPDDTLEDVLRRAKRPVSAISTHSVGANPVLLAFDGSPAASRALATFANSGIGEARPVQVVSVARELDLARTRAEEAARFLRHYNIRAEITPFVGKKAGDHLLAQVEERKPSLVVMGAFGGQRSEGFWGRSTTRRMLREADVSLFLHP